MFLKPTCTNDGDHPFTLFLVRNCRYVTNLIPTHVQTRVFYPLFLLLSSVCVARWLCNTMNLIRIRFRYSYRKFWESF